MLIQEAVSELLEIKYYFYTNDKNIVNWLCLNCKKTFCNINTKLFKNNTIESEANPNIFERRWEVLQEVDDESKWFKFSLASYNVLSQNLLDNNKHLYRICHPRYLSWQYRKEALKRELTYYQPDIICLQEVHFHEFSKFFVPLLQKLSYFGLYKKRTSAKEDGCATFFRHEKFSLEVFRHVEYRHKDVSFLDHDNVGLLLLIKPNLRPREPDLRSSDPRADHVLHTQQPSLSDDAKERLKDFRLCVANTHLLFNPLRGEVKLAQLMLLLASIDDLNAEKRHATIVCGDFNSPPDSGLYKFAQSGRIECKEVHSMFFSGQLKPSKEDLQQLSRTKPLSPLFLQKLPFITDQCQFVDVLKRRLEQKAEKNRDVADENNVEKEEDEEVVTPPYSFTQGSGVISHNLLLDPVYDHSNYNDHSPHLKEVSFYIEKNRSKVDYIFYSQTERQKCSRSTIPPATSSTDSPRPLQPPPSLKEIHLLRRLKLWTEQEVRLKYPAGMPNQVLASDHLIVLAEFGVRIA